MYRALWKDEVLRAIESYEMDVHVKNGVVCLSGHIVSTTSQSRIKNALRAIPGLLGIQNNLVPDDKLTREVAASSMIARLRTSLLIPIISMRGGVSWVLAIFLDVALFMGLYMMLPHGASTWRAEAGFLWELAKKTFLSLVSTYISFSNLVYGSVVAMIAFLAWAYLSGLSFLFGAYLSVAYVQLKQQQKNRWGNPSVAG